MTHKFYDLTEEDSNDRIQIIWSPQVSRFFYGYYRGGFNHPFFIHENGLRIIEITKDEYKVLDKYLKGMLRLFVYEGFLENTNYNKNKEK